MVSLVIRTAAFAVLLIALATPVTAGFDEGVAAHDRGDYATALREWQPLAEQGHAEAQHNLDVMYDYGKGVAQDHAEALRWYKMAAEQGHAEAQSNLGVMYDKGRGVPEDYVEAHKWFNLSASQGLKKASENRDILAERMAPAQIAEAQRLAREWMEKHGKK